MMQLIKKVWMSLVDWIYGLLGFSAGGVVGHGSNQPKPKTNVVLARLTSESLAEEENE